MCPLFDVVGRSKERGAVPDARLIQNSHNQIAGADEPLLHDRREHPARCPRPLEGGRSEYGGSCRTVQATGRMDALRAPSGCVMHAQLHTFGAPHPRAAGHEDVDRFPIPSVQTPCGERRERRERRPRPGIDQRHLAQLRYRGLPVVPDHCSAESLPASRPQVRADPTSRPAPGAHFRDAHGSRWVRSRRHAERTRSGSSEHPRDDCHPSGAARSGQRRCGRCLALWTARPARSSCARHVMTPLLQEDPRRVRPARAIFLRTARHDAPAAGRLRRGSRRAGGRAAGWSSSGYGRRWARR